MNKRGIVLVFVFLLFASVFVSGAKVSSEIYDALSGNETVRVFVKIAEESKSLRDFSTKSLEESKGVKDRLKVIHDFGDTVSVELNRSQIEELENSSEVLEIFPVEIMHIFLDSSVPVVSGNSVWKRQVEGINLTGAGETVCVVDTGVDFTHPALVGKNLTCVIDCMYGECSPDCSVLDWSGHGTHVSGIIASHHLTYRGVSPDVNLIGVRVCDADGDCYLDDISKGISWCVTNSNLYNISVISMSLGGGKYTSYCDGVNLTSEINSAFLKNISVVVATGNDNYSDGISSPACIKKSIRVSSIDDNRLISSFSNRGDSFLDILFAPGKDVVSSYIPYGAWAMGDGTSMSTPHVSGAIAILNQYRRLEGLPRFTPSEITNLLVSSGEELDDSASGGTYTILNVSSLILSADESSPKIVSNNLENNSIELIGNISFNFNVSDLQTTNVSFYLWNSFDELVNSSNFSFSGNNQNFNLTFFIERGIYSWEIYAIDANENEAYLGNYTLYVGSIFLNDFSPENNFGTYDNYSEFFCEFDSLENELSNISFYLWNSSDLIYNETKIVSGYSNSSTFNWTFEVEENYFWNCNAENSLGISSISISNYSFSYDFTFPIVSLVSPDDNAVYTGSQTISFDYFVNESNLANCSLFVDDLIVSTVSSSLFGKKSFSYSLGVGAHTWKVGCFDVASNYNDSSLRNILINPSPRSSGGGGSSSTVKKEEIKNTAEKILSFESLQNGVVEYFYSGESANFSIGGEKHRLVVNSFSSDSLSLDIFSNPINLFLNLYEPKKVNINGDGYYDLEIFYSGIVLNKSSLFLKEIHEEIQIMKIFEDKNESLEEKAETEIIEDFPIQIDRIIIFVLIILILFFFSVLIILKLVKAIIFYSNPVNKYISNYEVPRR